MQGQAFRVFLKKKKNIYIYIYKYKIALRVLKLVNGLIVVGFAFIDLSKKKKKNRVKKTQCHPSQRSGNEKVVQIQHS